jgi:hypothetical protein
MDETAYTYAIGPTHIFLPIGPGAKQRARGSSSAKARVTAVVMVNGVGKFAPNMVFIKHKVSSLKSPDQTRNTVIKNLHKKPGYTEL